ncbi:hypothetical protein [Escherichia phage BYEP02]|nr:hypothetical protein [Escherichia phage BYEP02]
MKFSDFSQSGKPSKADEYLGLLMAAQAYFHSAHKVENLQRQMNT